MRYTYIGSQFNCIQVVWLVLTLSCPKETAKRSCTKVYRLVLNSPYKFPLAYGETMTMMTPCGVIGWERVIA